MVRSLRYFLSLVRWGEGGRGRSRTLSFLDNVGLIGGEGNDASGAIFCWRDAGRITLLYMALLFVVLIQSLLGLREKRRRTESFL
jgi:hypothetical protein